MAGLQNRNEDQYKQAIRKFQRVLETKGISMSLRQLKAYDTIELAGTAENGQERVLMNDVRRKFGDGTFLESEAAKIMMPFIPEGVLKARTVDKIYYTYFAVEDEGKDSDTFGLNVLDYQLCDGLFQLRCFGAATDIPKALGNSGKVGYKLAAFGFPDFMGEITDADMLKEMSEREAAILRQASTEKQETRNMVQRQAQQSIKYMLSTFSAINFLNEQKRKEELSSAQDNAEPESGNEEERKLAGKGNAKKEPGKDGVPSADSFRTVKIGDWYTYRSTYRQPTAQGKSFIRHTEQWLVTWHMRHYKSGKTVYIQPYYKGPGRDKERTGKTVFRIEKDGQGQS